MKELFILLVGIIIGVVLEGFIRSKNAVQE